MAEQDLTSTNPDRLDAAGGLHPSSKEQTCLAPWIPSVILGLTRMTVARATWYPLFLLIYMLVNGEAWWWSKQTL
jgi:hypothetical protein